MEPLASRPHVSVVIPVLDEEEGLKELHRRASDVLTRIGHTHEIIFVDDGSRDDSLGVCRELAAADPHVVIVELRRNFGKATALQAGFHQSRGDVVITMDADLQDDPDEIPRLLEALEGGLDLVSGWKRSRQDPLDKTLPSRVFNFVTARLTKIPLQDFGCGLKAYRREVVQSIDLYGELHRYIPVLAHAKGFRVGEIPVRHHPRIYGQSKYSFKRVFSGAFDLLTILFLSTFQRRPLHLFGMFGLTFLLAGFAIDSYLAALWLSGENIGHRPLLVLGTLLIIVGIQALIFGLLGEMITATTYDRHEVQGLFRRVHRKVTSPDRRPPVAKTGASDDVFF